MATYDSADTGPVPSKNKGHKMIDLIQNWLSFVRHRHSHSTYDVYRAAMIAYIEAIPSKATPDILYPLHIEQTIAHILDQNKSRKTANTYLAAIKAFYRWAEKYHSLENISAPIKTLRVPHSKIRILSDDEYQLIVKITTGLYRDTIQFLANTGLRRAEFISLRWGAFNNDYVHIIGKGEKSRSVPLNDVCKKIIGHKHIGPAPYFVLAMQRKRALYKLCTDISKNANIEYFTPHTFRHYFATRLIRAGVPLIIVSKLLGHSNTQITEQIYIHLVPQDLNVTNVLRF